MLDDDAAGDYEHDVALVTPMFGDVLRAEIDEAKLNFTEFLNTRSGCAGLPEIGGG